MSGRLIVISGPSGVGKTTVADALLNRSGFQRVVTATSRPPRPGEKDGVHYHFLDVPAFESAIRRGKFLEHATVHGNLYGTPREEVEAGLKKGRWLLLNIDVQGARQVREAAAGAALPLFMIFLVPPDMAELERRLHSRGTEGAQAMARRLETARRELSERDLYDRVVVNDDVERAVGEVLSALGYRAGKGSKETT